LREVANIEKAMDYIERIMAPGAALTEQMIRELHAMTSTIWCVRATKRPEPIAVEGPEYLSLITSLLTSSTFKRICRNLSHS